MEEWEQAIDGYPKNPDVKLFIKVLKTADVVIKKDLAPFELDWITSTLFFKPVSLLDTITSKRNDVSWGKPISDAFKLISDIVDKHSVEHLFENIVTLCLLPYTPQIRKDALTCMTRVARRSVEGARDSQRLIAELCDSATCKTQLAVLVGVIAEYHPEVITDSARVIWRTYLNLLESNKNTDTVINAVLQGLLGLFKHFGADLPIIEFRDLYERISKEYIQKGKCEEVCLSILEQHSNLFKELLATDSNLRQQLWSLQASAALLSVYSTIATALSGEKMQKILSTEVLPRVYSNDSRIKYTALRILRHSNIASASASTSASIDNSASVVNSASVDNSASVINSASDCISLAYELRHGAVSLDKADAILWCIESSALGSDKLLQTSVLFFHNLPASKRREIVVHGLLNSHEDIRTITVSLLINESTSAPLDESIDKFLPLWKELFDSKNGTDSVVLSKSRLVFEDFMEYLFMVVEAVLEEEMEQMPEKLSSLLRLTYHILTAHPCEDYTEQSCGRLLPLLLRLPVHGSVLSVATAAVNHTGEGLKEFCQSIRIDRCLDEASLCESCYMLVHAPAEDTDEENVLMAAEILLTRSDVEPKVLTQVLRRLETLINESGVDVQKLEHILSLVDKLRARNYLKDKDARILHRNVVVFMGKYGNNNYTTKTDEGTTVIAELKDKLLLSMPNPNDGTIFKLNLQRILQLAIVHEDSDVLQKLLCVICATLSTQRDPNLQLSLTLVARALCRAHAQCGAHAASIQQAVIMCGSVPCLNALIRYISEEKSPGVRKMLSDALESLLLTNPGSETTEQLVRVAAERACVMMASGEATIRNGGLNITETLLSALKDNHLLQTKELPTILTLILETEDLNAKNTFTIAYKQFLENLELYSEDMRGNIVEKLTRNITKSTDMSQGVFVKTFKNKVSVTLDFFKEIPDFDLQSIFALIDMEDNFEKAIYLMAEANLNLTEIDFGGILNIMDVMDFSFDGNDLFIVEAILRFLEVYSTQLLNNNAEKSLSVIKKIFSKLPPKYKIHLQKHIQSFLAQFTIDESNILTTFKDWYQNYNIKSIIEDITKDNIHREHTKTVKSLKIYIELLKLPENTLDDIVLNLNSTILDIYVHNGERYIIIYKSYLSDMLYISLRYKSFEEFKQHILKSLEKTGLNFIRFFIDVYSEYLLKSPYLLLDSDLKPICLILSDIVKNSLKKKITLENSIRLLEFINAMWPTYSAQSTFEENLSILVQTCRLQIQLATESVPIQWALGEAEGGRGERIVGVLPGGEECSASYKALACNLPARLSELSGATQYAFQAILDSLAATADCTLLDIVAKMANCDSSKGWWDEEMASCMAALARRGDCALLRLRPEPGGSVVDKREVSLMSIANKLFEDPSLLVCKRLLVPLLRYSTVSFCERFFSSILENLLTTLARTVRGDRDSYELRKTYKLQARAYTLITIAFEKIPLTTIKSPDSPLYAGVEAGVRGFLIRRVSALCAASRAKPCPDNASSELQECYRQFHIANYKCLCAAVCVSRPAAKFYRLLFSAAMWEKLFSCRQWKLPIRMQWTQQKTVHTVADAGVTSIRSESTTRTRMFLRTLSENPLNFDLMDPGEETTENSHEIELVDNELNSEECADTVTALIRHACALPHTEWAQELAAGLRTAGKVPLAQMICNCREQLAPHADALRTPLLELTASTPREDSGRKLVNGLHVDILETLLLWKDLSPSPSEHLNTTIEHLINSCIDNDNYASMQSWLVGLLNRVLDVYGTVVIVPWKCFESLLTVREKQKTVLKILLIITKHKIHIPELVPAIISLDEKFWLEPKLAELFGQALACESETERSVSKYRQFLEKKRQRDDVDSYIKLLYYAQIGYPKICDEYHFKMILQLTARVVGHTKSKCLRIISSYISLTGQADLLSNLDVLSLLRELPQETMKLVAEARSLLCGRVGRQIVNVVVPFVRNTDRNVRAQAVAVMLNAFEDLFAPKHSEPPTKRSKPNSSKLLNSIESPDTYISSVINSIALAVTDSDGSIAASAREKVAAWLNGDDMKIRLAESFLLALSVPATLSANRSPSVCVACFLDLLLRTLRTHERFREAKLKQEALDLRDPSSSKLMINTRTYQGSFLSTSGRRRVKPNQMSTGINVQIPIDDILGSILSFAKDKPDASQALCVDITRALLATDRGFDARASLARLACDALTSVGDITPIGVEVARVLVDDLNSIIEFESALDKLRQVTKCTEGEELVQLLFEEYRLRKDADSLELGIVFKEEIDMDIDADAPNFEDVTSAFGKLSNWDKLTTQQKNEAQREVPRLWVAEDLVKTWLAERQVSNSKSWLNKMLSSYRDECKQDSLRWLRETDRWPRRHFDVSVITELIEGNEWNEQELKTRCDIRPADCLVEWAARLMLRRAYVSEQDSATSDAVSLPRSHELHWCRVANDRGLPHLAINCFDINASPTDDEDYTSWQIEKARAMRAIGLKSYDVDMLGEALSILESSQNTLNQSSANDVIMWNRMTAALHQDLGSILKENLQVIIDNADEAAARSSVKVDKRSLCALYEMAITFYDDIWSDDPSEQNDLLNKMADVLGHVIELDLMRRAEMFLALVLNRLEHFTADMEEDTARNVLEKISLLPHLDDTSLEQVKSLSPRFPPSVLEEYPLPRPSAAAGADTWRRQFQLVCDVRYSLLRRCEALQREVNDPIKWSKSFDLLKENIFENPYADESTECSVLTKYKRDLYLIEDYDTPKEQKISTLKKIISELYKKASPRASLRLSQLCPALAKYTYSGSERDGCMSRLLGLGNLGVVRFYEQVTVIPNAVTRPVVLSALLTDGSVRPYIHKTGDRLKVDQSAQRVAGYVKEIVGGELLGYTVTPLGDDSGLIEFVENSTRLRDAINSVYNLDQVDIGARADDDELILSSASLEYHKNFGSQVPAHALRSAIEARCSSTEDFINKKQMFVETLAFMTLVSWIFGLGDRHLENILYSQQNGRAWCVDWAAMFAYGGAELCPARLTRNLLAVGDTRVLEARLQTLLSALRSSSKMFLNVVKASFKWMGDEINLKYPNIEQYATGKATSRDVTKRTLLASAKPYKERIIRLIDNVFSDLEEKDQYSVEEQITCLLRQCTDPRILSVTRSGWEPWV